MFAGILLGLGITALVLVLLLVGIGYAIYSLFT